MVIARRKLQPCLDKKYTVIKNLIDDVELVCPISGYWMVTLYAIIAMHVSHKYNV